MPSSSFEHSIARLSTSSDGTICSTEGTISTSRTNPGLGSLSGKAILAIGKAALRGAETLNIWRRLQVISSKFPHMDGDDIKGITNMYKDLLELSRQEYYCDTVRLRALRILLAQIGSYQIERLVQSLTTWSPIELEGFTWELTQLFDPFRLSEQRNIGGQSILVNVYQSSLLFEKAHSLKPLIDFFYDITRAGDQSAGIMETGVIDFLLRLYITCFAEPLIETGADGFYERSILQARCNFLLETYVQSTRGMEIISEHPLYALWPKLSFPPNAPGNPTQRVMAWRMMEPEAVFFRAQSIYNMMVVEDWWGSYELDSLDNVAVDILEFTEQPMYQDTAKAYIIDMATVLICSRRTGRLMNCLEIWTISGLKKLIPKLINVFHSLWLFITGATEELPHAVQIKHILNDPLESFVIFLNQLSQAHNPAVQAVLEAGIQDFLAEAYAEDPSHPSFTVIDFQSACNSLLQTCSTGFETVYTLQPLVFQQILPEPSFFDLKLIPDWHVRRAELWRSAERQVIHKRVSSMLRILQKAQPAYPRRLIPLEPHVANYIVADTLEFFGHDGYPNIIRLNALNIISVLIGSRRTKELVHNLIRRPSQRLTKMVISCMAKLFDPPWPFIRQKAEALPPMVRAYERSLASQEHHSLAPLIAFYIQVAQTGCINFELEGAVTDLLFHLYMSDFLDPLWDPTGPQFHSIIM